MSEVHLTLRVSRRHLHWIRLRLKVLSAIRAVLVEVATHCVWLAGFILHKEKTIGLERFLEIEPSSDKEGQ